MFVGWLNGQGKPTQFRDIGLYYFAATLRNRIMKQYIFNEILQNLTIRQYGSGRCLLQNIASESFERKKNF
jgi:hypothetical protein